MLVDVVLILHVSLTTKITVTLFTIISTYSPLAAEKSGGTIDRVTTVTVMPFLIPIIPNYWKDIIVVMKQGHSLPVLDNWVAVVEIVAHCADQRFEGGVST